jgi:ribosomal-protein-alanine N-acetyltransferase
MEWCREQGAGVVELEVRAGSVGAIGLYEGLGFVATGRRRGYYKEPVEDALLMQMELRG